MANPREADRKRRHVSSISPTAAVAMAKKQPFSPLSEDKKIDTGVLMFQNQKLAQTLEVQNMEIEFLQKKIARWEEKLKSSERLLTNVNSWFNKHLDDLEARSIQIRGLTNSEENTDDPSDMNVDASSSSDDTFSKRFLEQSYKTFLVGSFSDKRIVDLDKVCEKVRNILANILAAVDGLDRMKDRYITSVITALPEDDCRRKALNDMFIEMKNLRSAAGEAILKYRSSQMEWRRLQAIDWKNKAELKYLREELEITNQELEECNKKVAALKLEKDATKGTFLPVLNMGNKHLSNDRPPDKQKEVQEMESRLNESMAQSSLRLEELKHLLVQRIEILKKLSSLQGTSKNLKSISSTKAFQLVKEDLEKSKADVIHCQALLEKLQVEKDKIMWKEREAIVRNELGDIYRRSLTIAGSRIDELETHKQRHSDKRKWLESKLEESQREPGRQEIITNFKEFVSSFPEDMSSMQSKLRKFKDTASDVHSLRAEVQSISNVLARKAKELVTLSRTSADQDAEIQRLQAVVKDLEETDSELKLFAEMFSREAAIPRNYLEARDNEYRMWARVHSLKCSLDEHNMELRVKTAIEAEALSQQRSAAAEAEIADLREKCESCERNKSKLSSDLKSKHEENEAYLSEIETIGQAYDDMQNQNQLLLKQITERDDYNIKLVLEGLRGKQTHESLLLEKQVLQKKTQQVKASRDVFEVKATRVEEQVKSCAEQIHRQAEDRCHNSIALENVQRRMAEAKKSSQLGRQSLDELQHKVKTGRVNLGGLQVELEKERFEKKRLEEELEAVKRKAERLKAQKEGSVVGKLHRELQEYKEILKCSICLDRPKEVVITKCYHLFCNSCVQKLIETRHRKCPVCAASFGPNDVKPVYI